MAPSTPTFAQTDLFRQQLQSYVTFTDAEWAIFSEHLYLRSLRRREAFAAGGKVCSEIAHILSGSFRFFFVKEGVEISNYFCFEGELISSYRSFLKREPAAYHVEALEDASLLCFSHASLQTLLQDDRVALKMERFGRLVAEFLICCYEDRVISFVTQTPEERYCHLLQQQPALLQRIPQHYVANFLGITPVSLSRIRRRMQVAAAAKVKEPLLY